MAVVLGPLHVLCKRCNARIKLSAKSSYDTWHWRTHRSRCLKRRQPSSPGIPQSPKSAPVTSRVRRSPRHKKSEASSDEPERHEALRTNRVPVVKGEPNRGRKGKRKMLDAGGSSEAEIAPTQSTSRPTIRIPAVQRKAGEQSTEVKRENLFARFSKANGYGLLPPLISREPKILSTAEEGAGRESDAGLGSSTQPVSQPTIQIPTVQQKAGEQSTEVKREDLSERFSKARGYGPLPPMNYDRILSTTEEGAGRESEKDAGLGSSTQPTSPPRLTEAVFDEYLIRSNRMTRLTFHDPDASSNWRDWSWSQLLLPQFVESVCDDDYDSDLYSTPMSVPAFASPSF